MKRILPAIVAIAALVTLWSEFRGAPTDHKEVAEAPAVTVPVQQVRRAVPKELRAGPGVDRAKAELAYAKALAEGQTPGVATFRVRSDALVDFNIEDAKELADAEGITLDEVRELTYFGHMAMRSQHWNDVEKILGIEISDEKKELAATLLQGSNEEFKIRMREAVAADATESQRWELIRETQENYLKEYFAITGTDANMLDRLLGGNYGGRPQAPAHVQAEHSDNLLARVNKEPNPNPEGIHPEDEDE